MTWDGTRTSAVGSRRLTAGAMSYTQSGNKHKLRPRAHLFDELSFLKEPPQNEEDAAYTHTHKTTSPSEITTVDQESEEALAVVYFFYFLLGLCD
jgi:hypothetical protein